MWHGLVNYRLGLMLGATMLIGTLVAVPFPIRIGNLWLRLIFLTAVWDVWTEGPDFLTFGVLELVPKLHRPAANANSNRANHRPNRVNSREVAVAASSEP
jgi:hypothetical protein